LTVSNPVPLTPDAVVFLGETFLSISQLRAELVRRARNPAQRTAHEHVALFSRRFPTRFIRDEEIKT